MDMDISCMDIHEKSVDMDMDMDVIFHIHGNPIIIPTIVAMQTLKRKMFILINVHVFGF